MPQHQSSADRTSRDHGFTLIELMVAVLVIAILIAIAIPTFLGARTRAQDRAAQSDLRNGLTTANVVYTDFNRYSFGGAALQAVETAFQFSDVVGNASDEIIGYRVESVRPGDQQVITLVKQSGSGTWLCLSQQNVTDGGDTAGIFQGSGGALVDVDTHVECTGGW